MAVKKIKRTKVTEPVVVEEVITAVNLDHSHDGEIIVAKKKLMGLGLLLLLLLALFWYKTNSWPVAAIVNSKPITRFELDQELYKQGGQQVLDNLITERLVQDELTKSKVTVSDDEVNARIDEIKASLGDSFDTALEAQGVTMEELKSQIGTQVKLEKLLASQASVSAEEIDQAAKDGNTDKASAEKFLRQQKVQDLISTWVQDLKLKAKIMIVGAQPEAPETQ